MTEPAKLPEKEYLAIYHGCCTLPENCWDDRLYLYCCACWCVDGLMRQQLANKEKTDPMSMDNGGWVAKMYFSDECFQWLFPCVLTERCLEGFSLGHSGNAAEKAIHKMEKRQLQAEVVTALVEEALPDLEDQHVRSKAQAIGTCCSFGRLYYAGYVLKKNKQNRGVVSSQPFTTVFYHPPGTNDAEFLIR